MTLLILLGAYALGTFLIYKKQRTMAATILDVLTKIDEVSEARAAEAEEIKQLVQQGRNGDQASIELAIKRLEDLKTNISNMSGDIQGQGPLGDQPEVGAPDTPPETDADALPPEPSDDSGIILP